MLSPDGANLLSAFARATAVEKQQAWMAKNIDICYVVKDEDGKEEITVQYEGRATQ